MNYYLPPNYIRGRLRIQVRSSVRSSGRPSSQISLCHSYHFQQNFTHLFLIIVPCVWPSLVKKKIQNGRLAANLDKIFPSVRSNISMPQLPFPTKFYTLVPYHSHLRMTKFGNKKIQNGRLAANLDKIFNSQYLYATATIVNQILHNCSL